MQIDITDGQLTAPKFDAGAMSEQTQFGTATAIFGPLSVAEMDNMASTATDLLNGGRLDEIFDSTLTNATAALSTAGDASTAANAANNTAESNEAVLAKVDTMLEVDGAAYRLTELATALAGGGLTAEETRQALVGFFQLLARKDAAIQTDRAAELALINQDEGSGAGDYSAAADSLEATQASVGELAVAGQSQPRVNKRAGRAYQLKLGDFADGTYVAYPPVRLTAGEIKGTGLAVSVDMAPHFGSNLFVQTVGTPAVSGGSITAAELGPRDTEAMVVLDGVATAGEERTATFDVVMESGDPASVTIEIIVAD
jgi:hypothetical protein